MLDIKSLKTLSLEEIKEKAPSIFTKKGIKGLSENYTHVPTYQIIEDMVKLGWYVVDAKEVKARKEEFKGFQKHLIVFRNPDVFIDGADGDVVFPQVVVTNSHDGKNSFIFKVGLFRMVCENGLIVADTEFTDMKIRHMGYEFSELQKMMADVLERLPLTVESMNKLKQTILTEEKALEFAKKAMGIRFDETIEIDLNDILTPTRPEDTGKDLWSIFNVVQEKLLDGGFQVSNGKKSRKSRGVKNFQQDMKINEELYSLVMEFAS